MDMIRNNSGIAGGTHSITSPSAHNAIPRARSSLVVSPIVIFDSYKNGTTGMSSRSKVRFRFFGTKSCLGSSLPTIL